MPPVMIALSQPDTGFVVLELKIHFVTSSPKAVVVLMFFLAFNPPTTTYHEARVQQSL
jgi:hypothetical protein